MTVKTMKYIGLLAVLIVTGIFAAACGDDEPVMPDLSGVAVEDAEQQLTDMGFTSITFKNDENRTVETSEIKGWVLNEQNVDPDTKISTGYDLRLDCITAEEYEKSAAQAELEAALKEKLDPKSAWNAVQERGDSTYPGGFELHQSRGRLAEEALDEDTWYLKATCTVANGYGEQIERTCEAEVTGTDDAPEVTVFNVY